MGEGPVIEQEAKESLIGGPYGNPTIYRRRTLKYLGPTLVGPQLSSMDRSCTPAHELQGVQTTDPVTSSGNPPLDRGNNRRNQIVPSL